VPRATAQTQVIRPIALSNDGALLKSFYNQ